MERVVITGIGLVTSIGVGTREPWRALLGGESGVGPITRFDPTGFRVRIAAEVKGWDPTRWIEKKKLKEMHRFTEFALGAAGAVETAVCALAIAEGCVPPTINLVDPDPEVSLDCVANTARRRPVRHAMNNSFGFGGTNCALVLSALSH